MKRHVLIVGGDPQKASARVEAAGFRAAWTDGKSADGSAYSPDTIRDEARKHRARGIVPGARGAIVCAASVARELGLPSIRDEASIALVTRAALRERLSECGISQPEYRIVWDAEEARREAENLGMPLFVSCGDACTGQRERRVDHVEDLPLAFLQVTKNRKGEAVVLDKELPGEFYSLYGFVSKDQFDACGIVQADRAPSFRFPRCVQYPVLLQPAVRSRMVDVCQRALHAIGLDRGGVRVEVLLTDGEPRVTDVDINPFSPWMPEDLMKVCGGNFFEGWLRTTAGKSVPSIVEGEGGAAICWIPSRSGRVQGVLGEEQARDVHGVVAVNVALAAGDVVGHVLDCESRDRVGYVIARGSDAAEALDVAHRAVEVCKIVTQAAYEAS